MSKRLIPKVNVLLQFFVFCMFVTTGIGGEIGGPQAGVWTLDGSPYFVTSDIIVPQGMTLQIEPGVIVKFNGYYRITVKGTLIAEGLVGKRIIFTSKHDKEFGNTQPQTTIMPTNKDWRGIEFTASSGKKSKLDICIIRYSDRVILAEFANPALLSLLIVDCNVASIKVNGKTITVQDGTIQDYNIVQPPVQSIPVTSIPTVAREEQPVPTTRTPVAKNATTENATDLVSGEEFTFGELMVISASKRMQPLIEAPAAISIITDEDIKNSGLTSIPDILRSLPGLDIFSSTAANLNINPRGYNRMYSNRTLVLVDGRTVYLDFFGVIFWNTLPVQINEIKRIEVIRGPGGSLYGANAYSGVINIITKKPFETEGTYITSRTGSQLDSYEGSVVHASAARSWKYRLSAGWKNVRDFTDIKDDALKVARANLYLERSFGNQKKFSMDVGHSESNEDQLLPWGIFGIPVNSDIQVSHGKMNFVSGSWKFQSYLNSIKFDAIGTTAPFAVYIKNNLLNVSAEHSFQLGSVSNIIWGATYRLDTFDGNVAEKLEKENLFSFFVQEEIKPSEQLMLTFGARIDNNPASTTDVPWKCSLILAPNANNSFRFSIGKSNRSPSLVESFVVSQFGNAYVLGNDRLESEDLVSIELGFRGFWFKNRFKLKVDLFKESLNNFIEFGPSKNIFTFSNGGESKNQGAEIECEIALHKNIKLTSNYSYQKLADKSHGLLFEGAAPKNKANLGLMIKVSKLTFNLRAHYVDKSIVTIAPIGGQIDRWKMDEYYLTNIRIGYKPTENIEASVSVYNLFDDEIQEYPLGVILRNRIIGSVLFSL